MPSTCGGDWKSKVSPQIRKTLTAPGYRSASSIDDDAVLCEHDVALDRKLVELVDDLDSPLSRVVGERPELGRVDDGLVPEPEQLGADRDEVNLGAPRLVHEAVRQDEAHISIVSAPSGTTGRAAIQARGRHRWGGVHRLAPVRCTARSRQHGDVRRQPRRDCRIDAQRGARARPSALPTRHRETFSTGRSEQT